jgi:hypothetical protein
MKNTLIKDNFEEISKLSTEDRQVILTYFENWTENSPAEFEDGSTLSNKFEGLFSCWLSDEKELDDDIIEDILSESHDSIIELASYNEYDVQTVIDVYNGNWGDIYEKFEELYDLFSETSN